MATVSVSAGALPFANETTPDASSARSIRQFLEEEKACKTDTDTDTENTDSHIAELLREISRLQADSDKRQNIDDGRNIEDILSEAETLVSESSNRLNAPVSSEADLPVNYNYLPHRLLLRQNITSTESTRAKSAKKKKAMPQIQQDDNTRDARNVNNDLDLKAILAKKIPSKESLNASEEQFAMSFLQINETSNFSNPIQSPKLKKNDIYNRKLNAVLEKLKDTNEKFQSVQVQYELLVETNKQLKLKNDSLSLENKKNESELIEKSDTIEKLQKDLETIKLESSQLSSEIYNLKAETERLQIDKQNLTAQNNKDKVNIQDLQRQCKEMEGVMSRRHPDSVSALIVASKQTFFESETKKLLEKRVNDLENDIKNIEDKHKKSLLNIQDKVNSMKGNYETHIADLEKQVINLQAINSEMKELAKQKIFSDISTQTCNSILTVATQTQSARPSSGKAKNQNTLNNAVPAQVKEDSHLMATVRGLNSELATKEKCISKLNKELNDAKKSIQKLKESGSCVQNQPVNKNINRKQATPKSANIKIMKISTEAINNNPDVCKDNSKQKSENTLKSDFINLQKDYESLKKKRVNDLVELQNIHEKELMNLNLKVLSLQQDVDCLNLTVETLRDQIKIMDKQLSEILIEKNNLKVNNNPKNSTESSMIDKVRDKCYDDLKNKIVELERRYEGREVRLKTLISSLNKIKDAHIGGLSEDSRKYMSVSIPSHSY